MADKIKELEKEMEELKKVCDQTFDYLEHLITGSENADPQTILTVAKTFGEIVDAKKDMAEKCYYMTLIEAMEENADEYGVTWNEDGPMERKYYRGQPRDSRGRYMSKRGYDEMFMPEMYRDRDMDRESMDRMYYSNLGSGNSGRGSQSDGREGRSGRSRRGYMESKDMHKGNSAEDKQEKMKKLEKYATDLWDDMKEMISDASPEERTMLRQKVAGIANNIQENGGRNAPFSALKRGNKEMEFFINGDKWNIEYVKPNSPMLRRSNGTITIGVTDNNTKTVYINNRLNDGLLEKVITHEIVHCFCFSYGIYLDIDTEELIADFIATYGREVFEIADEVLMRFAKII